MDSDKSTDTDISLIIPVYNRAGQVAQTLASVAAQSRRPGEVILVDNGSTDATPRVLEQWSARMRERGWRVTQLCEKRKGASRARQTGLEASAGKYVLFFDSDDHMPSDHIERIMRDFEADPQLDMSVWNIGYIRDGRKCGSRRILPNHRIENHMVQGLLCTAAYAVRRSLIMSAGGWNPAIGGWDDWELGIRLLLQNPRIKLDPEPRIYAVVQAESISGLGYLHKAGEWERAIDAVERTALGCADGRLRARLLRLVAYRRVNLAALYRHEGDSKIAGRLLEMALGKPWLRRIDRIVLRMAYLHTSAGLPAAGGIYPPLLR